MSVLDNIAKNFNSKGFQIDDEGKLFLDTTTGSLWYYRGLLDTLLLKIINCLTHLF